MLADDHAVVREGYRRLLEATDMIEVVGEAGSGTEAYLAFVRLLPDVIVMDLSLPDFSGIEATRRILARNRQARVLVFSMHEENIFPSRAFQAGALGYITKASAPEVLIEAVEQVARGKHYLSPDVARNLALREITSRDGSLDTLSVREFEILRLLAQGATVAEIAGKLSLQAKTVANYQSIIRQKLGAENAIQLIDIAFRAGLRNGEQPQ